MKYDCSQFHPDRFSFTEDPVLILEDFLSQEERKLVREAMARYEWHTLADIPSVTHAFYKYDLAGTEPEP